MARRGDTVECRTCSALLTLENDRVPWHRKPGTRFNCPRSGNDAENWDAVYVVQGLVLACPECNEKSQISNGQGANLVCDVCGTVDGVAGFLARAMAKPRATDEAKPSYRFKEKR